MADTVIKVDEDRAAALEAAVSAGDAKSVQAAVESAVDAWLTDQALKKVGDEVLQRLWKEGLDSGAPEPVDFAALKAKARRS